ncbi:MAG: DNA-protecting protein DprA [Rhodospirillales bacterium]|nr:DNA-protecting protein DprA [Rhodospirillales bacterium]
MGLPLAEPDHQGTGSSSLSDSEKLARLRLIRSENVGPVTYRRLLERFGDAQSALESLPDLASRGGRAKPLRLCTRADAEIEISELHVIGAHILFQGEPDYPPLLGHIDDAPPVLFVRGHPALLKKRAVALVGSRNASVNGRRFARDMANKLGEAGFLVVSGMARGIDTAAHIGALETGTVAVMGGGVDVCYPRENKALYDDLVNQGAVCTEVRIGVSPQARHFPRRNRIISGIARAIVVLEAGAKSGSLITARMALEQGREVFAVPGAPQDPRVKGSNALIRDGAQLTESADDVIRVLTEMSGNALSERQSRHFEGMPATNVDEKIVDQARTHVLQALDFGPTDVDDIIRETGCPAGAVHVVLLELEIAGRLVRQAGNSVSLVLP